MKKRFRGAFVLIPVVYAGVILLLLFLQFSDGQRIYETANGLTLEGRMTPTVERESSTVASLRVSYKGISFEFDPESSLRLVSEDGEAETLAPRSYTRGTNSEDSFVVRFEEGVELSFELNGGDAGGLQVRSEVPEALRPLSSIEIPTSVTGGASFEEASLPGVYPVRFESATYHLSPPSGAELDTDAELLAYSPESGTETLRYVRADTTGEDVFETWFSEDSRRIPDSEYAETISTYIDDAYEGWTDSRFNAGAGNWSHRSGSPRFSEQILTAALAEAWQREDYEAVFTGMRRAADEHSGQIGLLSAPFLGDLDEVRERFLEEDEEKTEELLELTRAEDPEVFRTPHLARFARDRGSEELYEAVLSFAEEVDYQDADMVDVLGMLRNYYLSEFPDDESEEAFSRFSDIVEERILPNLYHAEQDGQDTFFLRSSPDRVEVVDSVLAGRVLEEAGRRTDDPRIESVGRNLVVSALSFSDEEGFLPEVLYISSNGIEGTEDVLGPEELYELLHDNPAYPHHISLSEETGERAWIWAAAEFSRIDISEGAYEFSVEYPRNRTHYIIMQGIPSFSSMEIFGQEWRTDPDFESYVKGRHYADESETLMIKYTDDSVEGDIILEY